MAKQANAADLKPAGETLESSILSSETIFLMPDSVIGSMRDFESRRCWFESNSGIHLLVAEQADAPFSKSGVPSGVRVRFSPERPILQWATSVKVAQRPFKPTSHGPSPWWPTNFMALYFSGRKVGSQPTSEGPIPSSASNGEVV